MKDAKKHHRMAMQRWAGLVEMVWTSFALALALFAAASESYEVAKWEAGAAMPGARRGFGMARIPSSTNSSSRGHVMVAGGYNGANLDSVYMLDLDAGTWSGPAAAMPVALKYFEMVHFPSANGVGRGHVMVAGGRNGGVLDSVYMYNVDSGTWSSPAAAMPGARYGFGMVHIPSADGVGKGHVMVAGGHNGGTLDSVYMYNVVAGTWSGPAAAMPVGRYDFGMVHIPSADGVGRGHVMVAGGYNAGYLDSVYMYNVDAGTWSSPAAAMPVARKCFEMVHIPSANGVGRGQVMVAGGQNGGALDSVYMYNVDAGTWSGPAAAMPVARQAFGMVHIPSADGIEKGQVMVAGGVNNEGGFLNSVYISAPVTTTTTIPTSVVAASESYEVAKWEAGAAMPVANYALEMVHIPAADGVGRGQVMLAGGYNNGVNLDSVYMYNVDAGTWSGPAAAMPGARRAFGMVHIPLVDGVGRGQVMVAGGRNDVDGYFDSVYMYNVDAGTWSGPAAAMPGARGYFEMVHIPSADGVGRGHVMVAGGSNGEVLDSVYMYNVDAGTWSGPAAAMPVTNYAFGMVHIPSADGIDRGQVMVAGGYNNGVNLDSVYMYDVAADTFSGPVAEMPVANRVFGMVHIPSGDGNSRGHVMVAGGYTDVDRYFDCVYMYNVDAGTWSGPAAAMPVARRDFGMVHIPLADVVGRGQVMVAGGRNNVDGYLDSVYLSAPVTTTITIPTSVVAASKSYEVAKWEAGATMPGARSEFGMVGIPSSTNSSSRGHVMVAGGHNGANLDSVYMLDLDAGTWSGPAAAMPGARYGFGMVHIPSADGVGRGHVMVAGGYTNNGVFLDSVYMYNVDAGTWSGPAAAMPVARYGFGMVHIPSADGVGRGHVMVAGGYKNVDGYLDSVYMYNVDAGTWSGPAAAMPGARLDFGMVHIPSADVVGRGHVMVAGGITGADYAGYLDSVYMYNVDAGTWSGPAAAMPVARYAFRMVHIPSADVIERGQVMVAGGHNNGVNLDSVYMYNVDAGTWSGPAAAMPGARYAFGMVHIPSADGIERGQVMVVGGYNNVDGYLDSVYVSAPVTTTTTTTTTTTISSTITTTTTRTVTTTSTTTATTTTTTTTATWLYDSSQKASGGAVGGGVAAAVALLVIIIAVWMKRKNGNAAGNNGNRRDHGETIEMVDNPMQQARAAAATAAAAARGGSRASTTTNDNFRGGAHIGGTNTVTYAAVVETGDVIYVADGGDDGEQRSDTGSSNNSYITANRGSAQNASQQPAAVYSVPHTNRAAGAGGGRGRGNAAEARYSGYAPPSTPGQVASAGGGSTIIYAVPAEDEALSGNAAAAAASASSNSSEPYELVDNGNGLVDENNRYDMQPPGRRQPSGNSTGTDASAASVATTFSRTSSAIVYAVPAEDETDSASAVAGGVVSSNSSSPYYDADPVSNEVMAAGRVPNPMYQPADGPLADNRTLVRLPNPIYQPASNNTYDAGVRINSNSNSNSNRNRNSNSNA